MDHRWDEGTRQLRARRGRDVSCGADPSALLGAWPDRRGCLEDRPRTVNQSPWAIGKAWYDQRDAYTRNASVEADGYGCGPSLHPEEGSYAYPRDPSPAPTAPPATEAARSERVAWPWLNYVELRDAPYFRHLAPPPPRRGRLRRLWDRLTRRAGAGGRPADTARPDDRIELDVVDALRRRREVDASDVEVRVRAGVATLQGTVPSRESKRAAKSVAEGVDGVRSVHNRLRVRPDEPTDADVAFVRPLAFAGA